MENKLKNKEEKKEMQKYKEKKRIMDLNFKLLEKQLDKNFEVFARLKDK